MKFSAKDYALALYEITQKTEPSEVEKIVKAFLSLLVKHQALSQIHKIIYFYKNYYNQKQKIIEVQIKSARPLSETIEKLIREWLNKQFPHQEIKFQTIIDKNLIGGIIIRFNDYLIDGSLYQRLNFLAEQLGK
jgi:F-type H+-transporting ATPase subunit delta